jgi:hypothetical protein
MRRLTLMLVAAATTTAACGGSPRPGTTAPGGSGSVITLVEIERAAVPNAYEVVQKLRPRFLQSGRNASTARGRTVVGQLPRVILDDTELGGISELRTIDATGIFEIRFVSAADATTRWGTNHAGGVILVTSKVRAGR